MKPKRKELIQGRAAYRSLYVQAERDRVQARDHFQTLLKQVAGRVRDIDNLIRKSEKEMQTQISHGDLVGARTHQCNVVAYKRARAHFISLLPEAQRP